MVVFLLLFVFLLPYQNVTASSDPRSCDGLIVKKNLNNQEFFELVSATVKKQTDSAHNRNAKQAALNIFSVIDQASDSYQFTKATVIVLTEATFYYERAVRFYNEILNLVFQKSHTIEMNDEEIGLIQSALRKLAESYANGSSYKIPGLAADINAFADYTWGKTRDTEVEVQKYLSRVSHFVDDTIQVGHATAKIVNTALDGRSFARALNTALTHFSFYYSREAGYYLSLLKDCYANSRNIRLSVSDEAMIKNAISVVVANREKNNPGLAMQVGRYATYTWGN